MMSLTEIVEQLESCGYECEAGSLENDTAWQELRRLALLELGQPSQPVRLHPDGRYIFYAHGLSRNDQEVLQARINEFFGGSDRCIVLRAENLSVIEILPQTEMIIQMQGDGLVVNHIVDHIGRAAGRV